MRMRTTRLAVGVLAAGLAFGADRTAGGGAGKGGGPTEMQARALKQVKGILEQLKAPGPQVEVVTDRAVQDTFPTYSIVAVRFRMWPVAVRPPEGLKSQNLFAVPGPEKMQQITNPAELERFFRDNLGAVKNEAQAKTALLAYLRLAQELVQDGYYTFQPPDKLKIGDDPGGLSAEGDLQVKPERGNKGFLRAVLQFDKKTGKLSKVVKENKVVRGIRPRCQATRLLDPDPVIRAICVQDILVMGVAAREYLMEQRATAGPELRRAIDRIWQRILDEGR